MIDFYDFVPKIMERGGFLRADCFEELSDVMKDVNFWIDANNIDVVNIETVVLPNMHRESGSEDADIRVNDDFTSSWHQFIRVWYRR